MLKYGQMTLTVEMVTPAIAKKWLELNATNRRLRTETVGQYCCDMMRDKWERKPVAVCFDDDGKLGNGQHTLSAIAKSGKSQELLVARNVPRVSIAVMDRGRLRTLNDVANFLGADLESRKAGVARVVEFGPAHSAPMSFDELLDLYVEHKDVIDFVCEHAPRVAGINSSLLGVCAKAAYTKSRVSIARFLLIIRTGESNGPSESAAIKLRDFARSLKGAMSARLRIETYEKSMSALDNFLEGKPMSKLYGTSKDLFPLQEPRTRPDAP
jgi:hypothetical protein